MHNLDERSKRMKALAAPLAQAAASDDKAAFENALAAFAEGLQEQIMAEAAKTTTALIGVTDANALAARGVRQLTAGERTYYQAAAAAMRAANPKQALEEMKEVLPETVIEAVFEDIFNEHPLLNLIDFQATGALIKTIITDTVSGTAMWGELTGEIDAQLGARFKSLELTMMKLSAWLPVAAPMLDLGPEWLDSYVRRLLAEQLAAGLEAAIVDGDGKTKPIGMTRALSGATDGVYPQKTAVTVNSLDPVTIGGILDTVSKGRNNTRRAVPRLLMVVSMTDYYTKVYPATTIRAADGTFAHNALPYPMDVIPSAYMPAGKAVFGLAKRYFVALGSSKGGKLEYSDNYHFLEDERVYRVKLYGNGQPKDDNAFVMADISGIQPAVRQVEIVGGLPEA